MIINFIEGMILAWFLTIFGVDKIIIQAFQPFVTFSITINHYYVLFGILGALSNLLDK